MFTGWYVSPITGPYHVVLGYRVARGFGKNRTIQQEFTIKDFGTPDAAYVAAADLATLMNSAHDQDNLTLAKIEQLKDALCKTWAFASRMVERHGMDGDDTMSDQDHSEWQEAGGAANAALS